jgi:hypothetical protein
MIERIPTPAAVLKDHHMTCMIIHHQVNVISEFGRPSPFGKKREREREKKIISLTATT